MCRGSHGRHRMVGLLLAEGVHSDSTILVVGTGGDLKLNAMAGMQWDRRVGAVLPAARRLGAGARHAWPVRLAHRLPQGLPIWRARMPERPFDGAPAPCPLTLHFLPREACRNDARPVCGPLDGPLALVKARA